MKTEIIDYKPKHSKAFKELNEEWIRAYFKMEDQDIKVLSNPKSYILDKGGHIIVAIQGDIVIGVCALMKMDDVNYDYELGKMAVSPSAQGKGIGEIIAKSIIEKAKSLGASNLYLESNTILKPAISLYKKLGFKEIVGRYSPYERSNIQMLLDL